MKYAVRSETLSVLHCDFRYTLYIIRYTLYVIRYTAYIVRCVNVE